MASSIEEIFENLNEYSNWEELGSVSRAKTWITYARKYLGLAAEVRDQHNDTRFDQRFISQEMLYARRWVAANDTSGDTGGNVGVRFLGVGSDFRR